MAISSPNVQRRQGPAPMQLLSQSLQQMTSILQSRKMLDQQQQRLELDKTTLRVETMLVGLGRIADKAGGWAEMARQNGTTLGMLYASLPGVTQQAAEVMVEDYQNNLVTAEEHARWSADMITSDPQGYAAIVAKLTAGAMQERQKQEQEQQEQQEQQESVQPGIVTSGEDTTSGWIDIDPLPPPKPSPEDPGTFFPPAVPAPKEKEPPVNKLPPPETPPVVRNVTDSAEDFLKDTTSGWVDVDPPRELPVQPPVREQVLVQETVPGITPRPVPGITPRPAEQLVELKPGSLSTYRERQAVPDAAPLTLVERATKIATAVIGPAAVGIETIKRLIEALSQSGSSQVQSPIRDFEQEDDAEEGVAATERAVTAQNKFYTDHLGAARQAGFDLKKEDDLAAYALNIYRADVRPSTIVPEQILGSDVFTFPLESTPAELEAIRRDRAFTSVDEDGVPTINIFGTDTNIPKARFESNLENLSSLYVPIGLESHQDSRGGKSISYKGTPTKTTATLESTGKLTMGSSAYIRQHAQARVVATAAGVPRDEPIAAGRNVVMTSRQARQARRRYKDIYSDAAKLVDVSLPITRGGIRKLVQSWQAGEPLNQRRETRLENRETYRLSKQQLTAFDQIAQDAVDGHGLSIERKSSFTGEWDLEHAARVYLMWTSPVMADARAAFLGTESLETSRITDARERDHFERTLPLTLARLGVDAGELDFKNAKLAWDALVFQKSQEDPLKEIAMKTLDLLGEHSGMDLQQLIRENMLTEAMVDFTQTYFKNITNGNYIIMSPEEFVDIGSRVSILRGDDWGGFGRILKIEQGRQADGSLPSLNIGRPLTRQELAGAPISPVLTAEKLAPAVQELVDQL
jgi:hypothetical protein